MSILITRYRRAIALVLLLSLTLFAAAPRGLAASPKLTVRLDGVPVTTDPAPFIDPAAGRTYVPMRAIFSILHYDIAYNSATRTITATGLDRQIKLTIGSTTATVSGKSVTLTAAPKLVNNRTFVPLRFVAEQSGAQVTYQADTATVDIVTAPPAGWLGTSANLARTNYNPAATLGSSASVAWKSNAVNAVFGSSISGLALGDGLVFVSGHDKRLYALRQDTGAVAWQVDLPAIYMPGSPAFDPIHDQVYVVSAQQKAMLYAFDAKSGRMNWSAPIPNQYMTISSSPMVDGGFVLAGAVGSGYTLAEFNAADGTPIDQVTPNYTVAPMAGGGKVWILAAPGSSGNEYYPMFAAGTVVLAGSGDAAGFNGTTTKEVWEEQGENTLHGGSSFDGTLVWLPVAGALLGVNPATGEHVKRVTLGADPTHSCSEAGWPAAIGPTTIFAACGGMIFAVDRQTYQVTYLTQGTGPLALDGDSLYYLYDGGNQAFGVARLQATN